MKRSTWILIGLAILALLWVGREHFDATSYADVLARDTGEKTGYSCPPGDPTCAWGSTGSTGSTGATGSAGGATGSSGATGGRQLEPEVPRSYSPDTSLMTGPSGPTTPPAPSGTGTSLFSGNSTGGSSTSSLGPNSGGATGNLYGPEYSGVDAGSSMGYSVTGKPRMYPTLLGPKDTGSTMVEGVGVVPPSKNYTLAQSGQLPGAASLGLAAGVGGSANPMSRQPGDMDLIPDPYRVSQSYSTSSYSSKTEPVPFLSDFSAFMK